MAAGRPTKLTPEISKAIADQLLLGHFIETAVTVCRVPKRTFYDWLGRGYQDEKAGKKTIYSAFSAEIEFALAQAEIELINKLKEDNSKTWRKWGWLLERRFHDRYALKNKASIDNSSD